MPEPRCDLCGPYTPEVCALIVAGRYTPVPTGHLCDRCQQMVRSGAQALADSIDAECLRLIEIGAL